VKTRLAVVLGAEAAAEFYGAMLRDCLALANRLAKIENCTPVLCYTPPDAFGTGAASLGKLWSGAHWPQRGESLGERMIACISDLQSQGAREVLIIGSDAPDLPLEVLRMAFERLRQGDSQLVLGPAHDGGFTLLGTNTALPSALFDGIHWSAPQTMQQVCERAAQRKLAVNTDLPLWRDVDEIGDLQALFERLRSSPHAAPHSAAWLQQNADLLWD
jgi:rSAM/selenodomain-associated transferase 1